MANELLFDLEKLDLTAVRLSAEEVSKVLPQTGHMRMIDHVVWMNTDSATGLGMRKIRHDEFWVPHHIPGRPLFPGVLMIEAAAQLCSIVQTISANLHGFLGFTHCDHTVFRGQVVPGDTLYLLAKQLERNRRRFISVAQGVVNGKLVFETQITGMTM